HNVDAALTGLEGEWSLDPVGIDPGKDFLAAGGNRNARQDHAQRDSQHAHRTVPSVNGELAHISSSTCSNVSLSRRTPGHGGVCSMAANASPRAASLGQRAIATKDPSWSRVRHEP